MDFDESYGILKEQSGGSLSKLRAAPRKLVVKWHPDRLQDGFSRRTGRIRETPCHQ